MHASLPTQSVLPRGFLHFLQLLLKGLQIDTYPAKSEKSHSACCRLNSTPKEAAQTYCSFLIRTRCFFASFSLSTLLQCLSFCSNGHICDKRYTSILKFMYVLYLSR